MNTTPNNQSSAPPIRAIHFLGLLPPLLFVGFGVMLIVIGETSYRKTKITETWPSTQGTISATNIRRYNDEGTIRFAPEIDYEYTVAAKSYNSSVIRSEVFVSFLEEDEAKRFLRDYAAGTEVQVFYDPENPAKAVLQPMAAPVLHMVTIMGAISCSFAAMMYYFAFRRLRKRSRRRRKEALNKSQ